MKDPIINLSFYKGFNVEKTTDTKLNLDTTFINKKSAAAPTFCKSIFFSAASYWRNKCFWKKK